MPAPGKTRGGRAAAPARSNLPPPTPAQPPPNPGTTSRVTRSTSVRTNGKKRTVPDEEVPPTAAKPPKNQKKAISIESVHNIPSTAFFPPSYPTTNYPTTNSPHGYFAPSPRPLASHVFTPPQHNASRPLAQSPHDWPYPGQWTPQSSTSNAMVPPISHPPPYQHPVPRDSSVVIIDADDFSDGEGTEVGDDNDCEAADESTSIQFDVPHNVLHDHWRRNGPPQPTRLNRTPSMYPIPMQPTERTQDIQPIPTQRVPARQTAMPSVSARPTQAPMQRTFRRTATPALPDPPSVALAPVPAVLPPVLPVPPATPMVLPVPPATPMVLPSLQLNQSAPRSSYPSAWQDLIDHSCLFLLHDMLFSHPFPSGFDGQKWAREAVSSAFFSYSRAFGIDLDKKSFDEHRSNIVNLALRAARSHRGRFRSTILQMIYDSKDLGLGQKTSAAVVASRVDSLLSMNRFLDAQYFGDERPENAMYRSPILKKAIETLYTTSPWSAAINLPWLKDDGYHSGPQLTSSDNQGYTSCPPTSFVAFAASAFRNALDCISSGTEEIVAFSEVGYCAIYNDLYECINDDTLDPEHGDAVLNNIRALMANVCFSNASQ